MPFVSVRTSASLSEAQREEIHQGIERSVQQRTGKPVPYIMVAIEDGLPLYMGGKRTARGAMVEVRLLGGSGRAAYEGVCADLTQLLVGSAGLDPHDIYMTFEGIEHWGQAGRLF
ncbi:MAG: hypothetical protein K6A65_07285 [Succinivibrionaceae bacterium]|nr:hypothetical protein [Succinivibrionaceae bacterium]